LVQQKPLPIERKSVPPSPSTFKPRLRICSYPDEAFAVLILGPENTFYFDKALVVTSSRLEKTVKIDTRERQKT
jgi:hypothetical protein